VGGRDADPDRGLADFQRPGAMRRLRREDAVARRLLLENALAGRNRERRIGLVFQAAHRLPGVVISNPPVEGDHRARGGIAEFRRQRRDVDGLADE
jgi:hypothetical protein